MDIMEIHGYVSHEKYVLFDLHQKDETKQGKLNLDKTWLYSTNIKTKEKKNVQFLKIKTENKVL